MTPPCSKSPCPAPRALLIAAALPLAAGMSPALADAPELKAEPPIIYLADNLDEQDQLGYCIDTLGRNFSEQLQAHSCKPAGGDLDTQFLYDMESGQIRSHTYAGKCATLSAPDNAQVPFGLLDCVEGDVSQQFVYDAETFQFMLASDETQCLAVSPTSSAAGPFMSRSLVVAPCAGTDPSLMEWVIY